MKPTEKLIELLESQGLVVHRIHRALGWWTHMHQDVQRFQAVVTFPGEKHERTIGCWHTITECARRGIEPVKKSAGDIGEIQAKPKKGNRA